MPSSTRFASATSIPRARPSGFHEGFADVIAPSRSSQCELVEALLRRNVPHQGPQMIRRADVAPEALKRTALFGLAEEMGQEMEGVRGDALPRSATLGHDRIYSTIPSSSNRTAAARSWWRRSERVRARWSARIESLGGPRQQRYPLARVAEEGSDVADALTTF